MLITGIVPKGYRVNIIEGRRQPYTVWYDRPTTGGKVKPEVVAFCETWGEARQRIETDDPSETI